MKCSSQLGLVRTTLALPADLVKAIDKAIQDGKARSRNEFVALALRHELAAQKRAQIDAAFAAMADDADYQPETLAMVDEFAVAGWEAFELAEKQP